MYNHYKPLQGSTVVNIRRDFVRQLKAHRVVATAEYVGPQERGDDELEAELEHWFSLCQKDDCTVVLLSKKNFDMVLSPPLGLSLQICKRE